VVQEFMVGRVLVKLFNLGLLKSFKIISKYRWNAQRDTFK
jgi:hypothetical protein